MPSGVALARSRVPSSRSTVSCWATVISPENPMFMPRTPGSVIAPSEKPPTVDPRWKDITTSRITVGNR